ncbi:MAG: hypothetical protein OEZ33_07960 [Gammaproteobacteria bacterium]|nr:hypothetical protein [Gammaproteobacteria bacterium]MDH5778130.1 hypothetical protein [Gammaproteobacteria bacterium]
MFSWACQIKNTSIRFTLVIVMFLNSGSYSFASDDNLLRGRATLGYSSYTLSFTGSSLPTSDVNSTYMFFGAGATFATGKIYFDAAFNSSMNATHDWSGFNGDFERFDMAFTGGYLLSQGWSVFGGFKTGESIFYQDSLPGYRLTFEAFGPFVGGSKVIHLDQSSSVSLSAALAIMTGDIFDNFSLNDSGNTYGLSVSASYNLPLGDNQGLKARANYHSYSFSDFSTVVDVDESILSVEASYYMNF